MTDHAGRSARHDAGGDTVWDAVAAALHGAQPHAEGSLTVVDIGGGSGTTAVQVAALGHDVTVVDPSPNALAALQRRAAEAGVDDRVRGIQGDASDAGALLGGDADVVLCHGVLEVVDDPVVAVQGLRRAMRDDGVLSVVTAQRLAAVLSRALTGHLAEAEQLLAHRGGQWGSGDPLPRRFDEDDLLALLTESGFDPVRVRGLHVVSGLVPGAVRGDAGNRAALERLDRELAELPAVRAVAPSLQVLARAAQRS